MVLALDYRDSRPLYEQVRDELRKLVLTGALEPGEKLPSVRQLASQLAINPNTIQRAYRELEQMGVIDTVAGKGAFVAQNGTAHSLRRAELEQALRAAASELAELDVPMEDVLSLVRDAYEGRDEQ